jgi:hypothetical protein
MQPGIVPRGTFIQVRRSEERHRFKCARVSGGSGVNFIRMMNGVTNLKQEGAKASDGKEGPDYGRGWFCRVSYC